MVIKLTPDIEEALAKEAETLGTTVEQLALASLRERFVPKAFTERLPKQPQNLAEYLDGYVGILHSSEHMPGGARLSEKTGEKFAACVARQRREQRP
jgi:hypothetical protein